MVASIGLSDGRRSRERRAPVPIFRNVAGKGLNSTPRNATHTSVTLSTRITRWRRRHMTHTRAHALYNMSRSQLFSHKTCMHAEASAGSAPGAALRRLRTPPAAPRLRAPRGRRLGRRWHRCNPAAASEAAAAAARLLLRIAEKTQKNDTRAAAGARSGAQTAAAATARAAVALPAAPAAATAALAAATAVEAAFGGLRRCHTERAETRYERPRDA